MLAAWLLGGCSVTTVAALTLLAPAVGFVLRLKSQGFRTLLVGPIHRRRARCSEGAPYLLSSAVCDLYGRMDAFLFLWLASFAAQGLYAVAVRRPHC